LGEARRRFVDESKAQAEEALRQYKDDPAELGHVLDGIHNMLLQQLSRPGESGAVYEARVGHPYDEETSRAVAGVMEYIRGMHRAFQVLVPRDPAAAAYADPKRSHIDGEFRQ
jgi:hypothetical protein